MIHKLCSIIFFVLMSVSLQSQILYGITVPDSIKKKCDEVIISEIGQPAFNASVKYIKCDMLKSLNSDSYTVFYAFTFPNVRESHVIFSVNYKKDLKQGGVVKDGAFKNYTRLPLSVKTKGSKVIPYAEAKKIAVNCDSIMKKNQDKLFGEISTDYNDKKKDYFFTWYFYYLEPCKGCPSEQYKTYSVYIDASSGKVLNSTAKMN
jgi:hypothetical protein